VKIGLFTDVYHPSVNGISFVVDITKKNLEARGHEVWIIAPKPLRRYRPTTSQNHTIRFAAIQGMLFDEQFTSFFFPPRQLRRLAALGLDAIIVYSPGQIGCMGVYSALKLDIPFCVQYGTDFVAYIKQYRSVIIGMIGLALAAPLALQLTTRETMLMLTWFFNFNSPNQELTRSQRLLKSLLGALHERADYVISVSDKTTKMLEGWKINQRIETLPTAVDELPPDRSLQKKFAKQFGIGVADEVILYTGRLAAEKNLDMLVQAFDLVAAKRPQAKLLLVGGFAYRAKLEAKAQRSRYGERIIFSGPIAREKLGSVYALADIFAFPSLTDTQALVLNEAAHAGLPLVWCDSDLNGVLVHKETGLQSANGPHSFAIALLWLLEHPKDRRAYGQRARRLAAKFTEAQQGAKLDKLIRRMVAAHDERSARTHLK
jgi:1,2-diacylglycerol 3-alpha-glucosyltransferase